MDFSRHFRVGDQGRGGLNMMFFLPLSRGWPGPCLVGVDGSITNDDTPFGEIISRWRYQIWDNEDFVCKLELHFWERKNQARGRVFLKVCIVALSLFCRTLVA
jgi:hypothetical protein